MFTVQYETDFIKVALSRTKKPLTQVSGFGCRGGRSFRRSLPLGLKIPEGGIHPKPLPAAQACFFFVCDSLESKLSLSRTKKPLTCVSGFGCRGGRIRTCDLLVPNQAP